jgi:hypothetical protein
MIHFPTDLYSAHIGEIGACDYFDERGFSSSILSNQGMHFTLPEVKGYISQGVGAAKSLVNTV